MWFLSLTCEDIGVAMVTKMISQLQESFPLRRAACSFEISITKWLRGAKTIVTGDFLDEWPNFHIDTFSELEEHSGRFAEVSESDVEKFIEEEENANTKKKPFYDLKLVKKFLVEERQEIREIEKIPPTELDSYLSQFVLAARTKTGKDFEPSSLRRILAS